MNRKSGAPADRDRRIQSVIFDLGNTLLFPNYALISEELSRYGVRVGADDLFTLDCRRRLSGNTSALAGEDTEGFWIHYWRNLFLELGLSLEEIAAGMRRFDAVNERIELWVDRWPWTRRLLSGLRDLGLSLGVVSNSDGRVQAYLRKTNLLEFLDVVIDSHLVGVRKPASEIFLMATNRLGREPGECLYVGDIYPIDVKGAQDAGLQAVLLAPLAEAGSLAVPAMESLQGLSRWIVRGQVGQLPHT